MSLRKTTSEQRAQKFHTDDVHYPDCGSASDWLKENSLAAQPITNAIKEGTQTPGKSHLERTPMETKKARKPTESAEVARVQLCILADLKIKNSKDQGRNSLGGYNVTRGKTMATETKSFQAIHLWNRRQLKLKLSIFYLENVGGTDKGLHFFANWKRGIVNKK